jgi:Zn-dependent M28 family amino/carboxypeptidase
LNVFNSRRISTIYNVVGAIKGFIEPDRYVIIGSHRDSWTFGSIDPSSAQSVLLEVSRSLMELKRKRQWQPMRTILFLSFSGEEYGLVGSTEWVEVRHRNVLFCNSSSRIYIVYFL